MEGRRIKFKTDNDSGIGKFLAFGIDYEIDSFDSVIGMFSTAIIELPDGTLKNISVENVQFVK